MLILRLSLSLLALSVPLLAQESSPPFANDAEAPLQAALEEAKRENKRVLVFFGSNVCVSCRVVTHAMTSDRALRRELSYEYEVVRVEVGASESNDKIAARFGLGDDNRVIPKLTVVDAAGKVLAHHRPQVTDENAAATLQTFLQEQRATPLDACQVLAAAQERAAKENKQLFIHLGAPWCGWCHRLEDWMAQPEIAPLLADDYLDVKIDQDRMTNGKVVAALLRQGQRGGIPWIVITDASLAPQITSDGPNGNTGFPVQPAEIRHFLGMLRETRRTLGDDALATIEKSLQERAQAILDARRR